MWRVPLFLLLVVAWPSKAESPTFPLHIIFVKGNHVIAESYTPPVVEFNLIGGLISGGIVEGCKQDVVYRRFSNFAESYPVVILTCDDGVKMELKAITFK